MQVCFGSNVLPINLFIYQIQIPESLMLCILLKHSDQNILFNILNVQLFAGTRCIKQKQMKNKVIIGYMMLCNCIKEGNLFLFACSLTECNRVTYAAVNQSNGAIRVILK